MQFIPGERLTADKMNQLQPDTLSRIHAGEGITLQRTWTGLTISTDAQKRRGGIGAGDAPITSCVTDNNVMSFGSHFIKCRFPGASTLTDVLLPATFWPLQKVLVLPGGSALIVTPQGYRQRHVVSGTQEETQAVTPAYHTDEVLLVAYVGYPRETMLLHNVSRLHNDMSSDTWYYWSDLNVGGKSWAKLPDRVE